MNQDPQIVETDPFEAITSNLEEIRDTVMGLLQDKVKYMEIKGIPVPYIPSEQVTVVLEDNQTLVRDIAPAYITNFQQWEKSGNPDTLAAAQLSAKKEILLYIVRELALKMECYEAPLAVSTEVPYGHIYFDGHRIIINEGQATQRYMDADGDRAAVLFNLDRSQCVLVKFPITSQPPILNVIHHLSMEKVYELNKDNLNAVLDEFPVKTWAEPPTTWFGNTEEEQLKSKENWDKMFWDRRGLRLKAHKEVPVGLITSAWNSYDLYRTRGMDFQTRIQTIYTDPQRALDIEDFGMKAVRKDTHEHAEADVLRFGATTALDHRFAWALTSASQIGNMRPNQLEWVFDTDLANLVTRIRKLDVEFRKVQPAAPTPVTEYAIDGDLVDRLKRLGLLRWEPYHSELPGLEWRKDYNLPPACMVYLSLPNGTAVGLTDVKRGNQEEGMTFAFLLPPVYDNLDLYDEKGNLVSAASHTFMHPIDHMAKILSTFDSRIINPTLEPDDPYRVTGHFPRDWDDFRNPVRAVKVAMLQKRLQDYCGIYGDPCPAHIKYGKPVPSDMAFGLAVRSVVVDYGRDMNEFDMEEVLLRILNHWHICELSTKGTSRRIRKYTLASKNGGFIMAPKTVHPARPGKGRAQLQRALKPVKMRVAVVRIGGEENTKLGVSKQILITPSGIEKQKTEEAFLPQVFNTWEGYQRWLTGHGKTEETLPAKEVHFHTWTGEHRVCWAIGPRSGIKIGKLVDFIGNKFMPRKINQIFEVSGILSKTPAGVFEENGEEIDLVFPVAELVDKYNHHSFLKGGEEKIIHYGNQRIKAIVVEKVFFRTGSASENIPPRERRCNYKGIDSFPILASLSQIRDVDIKPVNMAFAEKLKEACLALTGETPKTAADPAFEELLRQYHG